MLAPSLLPISGIFPLLGGSPLGRFMTAVIALLLAGTVSRVQSQLPSVPFPLPEITISYISEVPWPSGAGEANPLERWAKRLSTDWAPAPTDGNSRINNLRPELSWNQLRKSAVTGRAQIFVIHGYELLEQGTAAKIEALLTPAKNGKAATTEFVIYRRREPKEGARFTMSQLEDQDILVDRGGCGDLVYRWLETEIKPDTGDGRPTSVEGSAHRETFAEFRSANNAAEAILSVYFGTAYACVVSRESSADVFRSNPHGLEKRLEEVRSSPALLKHIIACRKDIQPSLRKEVINSAAAIRLEHEGTWSLTVPAGQDMKSLSNLVTRWQELMGGKEAAPPDTTAPPPITLRATGPGQAAASELIPGEGRQR
jgi:hypothetical protein